MTERAGGTTTRRAALGLLAAGTTAGSFAFTTGILRAATVEFRIGDTVADTNPHIAAGKMFAKRLEELTKGQYVGKVFANGVLGSHTAMNDQLRVGTLEFAKSGAGFMAAFDKRLSIISLPYISISREKLYADMDGKLGKAYADITEQYGIKTLSMYDAGTRNVYTRGKAVKTPADLKGLRMRTEPDPIRIATFNTFGAQATPINSNEVYNALQQGVVDGAENSITYYMTTKHNEPAPYYSVTQHFFDTNPFMVSLKWYNEQPKAVQAAIVQAARETLPMERKLFEEQETTNLAKAPAAGVKLTTDVDKEAFQRLAVNVWAQFKPTLGAMVDLLGSKK